MWEIYLHGCFWSQMILIAISFHGIEGKMGAGGDSTKKIGTTPFQSQENARQALYEKLKPV